jgi:hypothetical protein
VGDPDQSLSRLEPPIEGMNLIAKSVEALEDRVELSVIEVLALWHSG